MAPERRQSRELPGLRARLSRGRLAFRHWRRSRPFWAGVITLLGAAELIVMPGLSIGGLTIHQGIAGIATWLMGLLMSVMALVMWFQPHLRVIAGIATILFALASFLTSNFGGFLLGMLLGLVGGAMAVAWDVTKPKAQALAEHEEPGDEPDEDAGGEERDLLPYDQRDQEDRDRDGLYGPIGEQPSPQQRSISSGERDHSLVDTAGAGGFSRRTAPR